MTMLLENSRILEMFMNNQAICNINVPEHSYQYDNAFMSSVVSHKQLSHIIIKSAVSISHLKGVNKY